MLAVAGSVGALASFDTPHVAAVGGCSPSPMATDSPRSAVWVGRYHGRCLRVFLLFPGGVWTLVSFGDRAAALIALDVRGARVRGVAIALEWAQSVRARGPVARPVLRASAHMVRLAASHPVAMSIRSACRAQGKLCCSLPSMPRRRTIWAIRGPAASLGH